MTNELQAAYQNLTAVQERCTQLMLELRNEKAERARLQWLLDHQNELLYHAAKKRDELLGLLNKT